LNAAFLKDKLGTCSLHFNDRGSCDKVSRFGMYASSLPKYAKFSECINLEVMISQEIAETHPLFFA
jgi:hypothetical protein